MKCPKCGEEIAYVRVYSECWQRDELLEDRIIRYGPIENVMDTPSGIECPKCDEDIIESIRTETVEGGHETLL